MNLPAPGEVWWCELPEIPRRPVVILTRDAAVQRLRRALVAQCTTNIRGLPTEVVLEVDEDPIPKRSTVNLGSVEHVAVGTLTQRLGKLGDARIREVCTALAVAAGISWPT